MPGRTSQAKEACAKFLDLRKGAEMEPPALKLASAEAAKFRGPGIRREVPVPGGPPSLRTADGALLLAGQFDGDAQQQLAIALFHLPKQAADSIQEAAPLARKAPLLGR
jgi:hypothetical protein